MERIVTHLQLFHDALVHISTMLVVNDLDESVRFYRDQLGFEIVEQDEWIVLLITGNDVVISCARKSPNRG